MIYGTTASTRDPARFAFAHAGKDGTPYPVDRPTYDGTIEVLRCAVGRAKVDRSERIRALKRLAAFAAEPRSGCRRQPAGQRPAGGHSAPDAGGLPD